MHAHLWLFIHSLLIFFFCTWDVIIFIPATSETGLSETSANLPPTLHKISLRRCGSLIVHAYKLLTVPKHLCHLNLADNGSVGTEAPKWDGFLKT